MFWLPRGWVPGYIEWILAFPRAQIGSISIQVWGIACASVVQIASMAIAAAWVLLLQPKVGAARQGEPMKMEGRGGGIGVDEKMGRERGDKEL